MDLIFKGVPSSSYSEASKSSIMQEVVGLYRFQLVKFSTEFSNIGMNVDAYYAKYLPYLSAKNFVLNMPIKDRERFESQVVESVASSQIVRTVVSKKPHLCGDNPLQLGLFRWINFANKRKLSLNELACLQISQAMLGFVVKIEKLRYFAAFQRTHIGLHYQKVGGGGETVVPCA